MSFKFNFTVETEFGADGDHDRSPAEKKFFLDPKSEEQLSLDEKGGDGTSSTKELDIDWEKLNFQQDDWETQRVVVCDGVQFECIWPQKAEDELTGKLASEEDDTTDSSDCDSGPCDCEECQQSDHDCDSDSSLTAVSDEKLAPSEGNTGKEVKNRIQGPNQRNDDGQACSGDIQTNSDREQTHNDPEQIHDVSKQTHNDAEQTHNDPEHSTGLNQSNKGQIHRDTEVKSDIGDAYRVSEHIPNGKEQKLTNKPKTEHVDNQLAGPARIITKRRKRKHSSSLHPRQESISSALTSHSDLVTGVYEGGLKIWECSLDLTEYLSDIKVPFQDLNVLELGCGAGLPGLYALTHGANVTFQDYNTEVLELVTARNILLTGSDHCDQAHLVSGPWSHLTSDLLRICPAKYSVILTSETIYNTQHYCDLVQLIKKVLAPNGVVYLAAKTYYFGVGGGLRQFEDFVRHDGVLVPAPCRQFTQGKHA